MVAPLRELDAGLNAFASAHGLEVKQNDHNTPNRMLMWTKEGIQRIIQISLYGKDQMLLLGASAFRDEGGKRHGKVWPAKVDIPLQEFKAGLEHLLTEAYRTLEAVSEADLEYWTDLSV
jgi:hypothetical protein